MKLWRIMASMIITMFLVALGYSGPVAAAELTHETFTFTLSPDQCPELQTTVTGDVDLFIRTNERTDKNGTVHLVVTSNASGVATDDAGNTYHFNYHNHVNVTIPPGEFPQQVDITDHFNLVGDGNGQSLHVGFNVRLTFLGPDEEPIVEVIHERGSPMLCDPF
jgi:hypothetical protein